MTEVAPRSSAQRGIVDKFGSLAMLAAIRRALVGEKHDLDQRRGSVCPSIQ